VLTDVLRRQSSVIVFIVVYLSSHVQWLVPSGLPGGQRPNHTHAHTSIDR
jgi:hypothetical protein